MATVEELLQELQQERAARQEVEENLQKAAEYGAELVGQLQEYKEKVKSLEDPERPQAQSSRRMSQRRASTVAFAESPRVMIIPGAAESDEEEKRPNKAVRKGRGGKTMMVEDLMQHNESLEEEVRQLQQQLTQEQEESEESEDSDARPRRRSRRSQHKAVEEPVEDPTVEYEAKIRALGEELEGVRKTCSARVKTLEVELDAKKQEALEYHRAEQDARNTSLQQEAKLKVLQREQDVLEEEHQKTVKELQNARAKERELVFQLEEQTLRGEARQSRRNWMPTACEEALRTAAGASLAEEFEEMDPSEESEHEAAKTADIPPVVVREAERLQELEVEALKEELEASKVEAKKETQRLKAELENSKATELEAAKEVELLRERLEAAKAETAQQRQVALAKEAELLQRQVEAESKEPEPVDEVKDLGDELLAAKEQVQVVLAENARLRQQIKAIQEAHEVPADEESFWDRFLGAIACARTPTKPAGRGEPGVRLAGSDEAR